MNIYEAYNQLKEDRFFSFLVPPTGYIDEHSPVQIIRNMNAPFAPQSNLHIFPGSFNPLHEAHKSIFDSFYLGSKNSNKCFYEISLERVGKEIISFDDLTKRLNQFSNYAGVWITRAMYFVEKAGLLREFKPHFHIGIDTAVRIVEQLSTLGVQGVQAKFYVYPRKNKNGNEESLNSEFPNNCPRNFIHTDHPRPDLMNVSSSKIREIKKA